MRGRSLGVSGGARLAVAGPAKVGSGWQERRFAAPQRAKCAAQRSCGVEGDFASAPGRVVSIRLGRRLAKAAEMRLARYDVYRANWAKNSSDVLSCPKVPQSQRSSIFTSNLRLYNPELN